MKRKRPDDAASIDLGDAAQMDVDVAAAAARSFELASIGDSAIDGGDPGRTVASPVPIVPPALFSSKLLTDWSGQGILAVVAPVSSLPQPAQPAKPPPAREAVFLSRLSPPGPKRISRAASAPATASPSLAAAGTAAAVEEGRSAPTPTPTPHASPRHGGGPQFARFWALDVGTAHDAGARLVGVRWNQRSDRLATVDSAGTVVVWRSKGFVNRWFPEHTVSADGAVVCLEWFDSQLPRQFIPPSAEDLPFDLSVKPRPDSNGGVETVDLTGETSEEEDDRSARAIRDAFPADSRRTLDGDFAFVVVTTKGKVTVVVHNNNSVNTLTCWLRDYDPVALGVSDDPPPADIIQGEICFAAAGSLILATQTGKDEKISFHSLKIDLAIEKIEIGPSIPSLFPPGYPSGIIAFGSPSCVYVMSMTEGNTQVVQKWLFSSDMLSDDPSNGKWGCAASYTKQAAPVSAAGLVHLFNSSDTSHLFVGNRNGSYAVLDGSTLSEVAMRPALFPGLPAVTADADLQDEMRFSGPILSFAASPNAVFGCVVLEQPNGQLKVEVVNFDPMAPSEVPDASKIVDINAGLLMLSSINGRDCDDVIQYLRLQPWLTDNLVTDIFGRVSSMCRLLLDSDLQQTENKVLPIQYCLYREFSSLKVTSGLVKIKLQIKAVTSVLKRAFRSPTLASGVLNAFLMGPMTDMEVPFSESVYLRKESIHHIGPLMLWANDFIILLLRNVFHMTVTRGKGGREVSEKLGQPNMLTFLLLNSSHRRMLIELVLILKLIRTNISLYHFALANPNNVKPNIRAMALKLEGTSSQQSSPEDQIYLAHFEQFIAGAKIKVEAVGNFILDVSAAFDRVVESNKSALGGMSAVEEHIFVHGSLPAAAWSILNDVHTAFANHSPRFFLTAPDGKPAPPETSLAIHSSLHVLFSDLGFRNWNPLHGFGQVFEGELPMRAVSVQLPVSLVAPATPTPAPVPAPPAATGKRRGGKASRTASVINTPPAAQPQPQPPPPAPAAVTKTQYFPPDWIGLDVITKCSLETCESIRQCTRCGEFSDARLTTYADGAGGGGADGAAPDGPAGWALGGGGGGGGGAVGAAGGSSSRSPSGGGGSPSSGSSSSSFSSSPRRTSSPRCRSKGCTDKALKTIGDCRLCNFKFCGKHRLPEAHGCAQFESLKQESFERNQKDLMDGKCVASKSWSSSRGNTNGNKEAAAAATATAATAATTAFASLQYRPSRRSNTSSDRGGGGGGGGGGGRGDGDDDGLDGGGGGEGGGGGGNSENPPALEWAITPTSRDHLEEGEDGDGDTPTPAGSRPFAPPHPNAPPPGQQQQLQGESSQPPLLPPHVGPEDNDPQMVLVKLMSMGFDPDLVNLALAESVAAAADADAASSASSTDGDRDGDAPPPPSSHHHQHLERSLLENSLTWILERLGDEDVVCKGILKPSPPPSRAGFGGGSASWLAARTDMAASLFGSVFGKIKSSATTLTSQIASAGPYSGGAPAGWGITKPPAELLADEDKLLQDSSPPPPPLKSMPSQSSFNPFTISDGLASRDSLASAGDPSTSEQTPAAQASSGPEPSSSSSSSPRSLAKAPRRVRFSFPDLAIAPEVDRAGDAGKAEGTANGTAAAGDAATSDGAEGKELVQGPLSITEVFQLYNSRCASRRVVPLEPIMQQIQDAFEASLPLSRLDLSGILLDPRTVAPICDLLYVDFGLSHLNLDNCGLTDDVLKHILHALLTSNSLPWLSLSNNKKLRTDAIKYISVFVKKTSGLQYLDLSGIQFDRQSAVYLAHAVASTRSPLQTLRLDNCRLRSAHLDALIPGIRRSAIVRLTLRDNRMPFDCASYLSDLIKRGQAKTEVRVLTELDLQGNDFRHGMDVLSNALARSEVLTKISLEDGKLDPSSLCYLADSLASPYCNLRILNLNRNPNLFTKATPSAAHFRHDSTAALKEALMSKTKLRELSLVDTGLSSEVAIAIAEALPLSKSLQSIDIRRNPLDLAGILAISVALRLNQSVVSLDIMPLLGRQSAADSDLAQMLNDISIYCQRNKEIQRQPTTNGVPNGTTIFDYPPSPKRKTGSLETLDSFTSENADEVERVAAAAPSPFFDNAGASGEAAAAAAKKESTAEKSAGLLGEAAETLAVFKDLLAARLAEPSSQDDIIPEIAKDLERSQSRIQRLVADGRFADEEELARALALNDEISALLASADVASLAAAPADLAVAQAFAGRRASDAKVFGAGGGGGSNGGSGGGGWKPQAGLSVATLAVAAVRQVEISPTVAKWSDAAPTVADRSLSSPSSSASSPRRGSPQRAGGGGIARAVASAVVVGDHDGEDDGAGSSAFRPLIPSAQRLVQTEEASDDEADVAEAAKGGNARGKGAAVVAGGAGGSVKANGQFGAAAAGPAKSAKKASMTSFESILDGEDDDGDDVILGSGRKVPAGTAEPSVDPFMAELDDQMKEIDDFLNDSTR
ncbi:hypothetical protein DFJ73DRAFT_799157 [Zopfochytrium polystomum]|nr:hypothetical protein DFJ73DRAFT_799157 [Zopfochytrium polystomum]